MNPHAETPQVPLSRGEKRVVIACAVVFLAIVALAIYLDLKHVSDSPPSETHPPEIMGGAPGLLASFMGRDPRIIPGEEVPRSRQSKPYDRSFGQFVSNFADKVGMADDPDLRVVVFALILKDRHEDHDHPCVSVRVFTLGMDRDQEAYHRVLTESTVPEGLVQEAYPQVRETLKTIQNGERL